VYALQGAALDPYNESPWRFLIGVVQEQAEAANDSSAICDLLDMCLVRTVEMKENMENKLAAQPALGACTSLVAAHTDLLEMKGDKASIEEAIGLVHTLATNYDIIRKKYWMWKEEELRLAVETMKQ